jgi:hypothetical protein
MIGLVIWPGPHAQQVSAVGGVIKLARRKVPKPVLLIIAPGAWETGNGIMAVTVVEDGS